MMNYYIRLNNGNYQVVDGNTNMTIAAFLSEVEAHNFLQSFLNGIYGDQRLEEEIIMPVSQPQIPQPPYQQPQIITPQIIASPIMAPPMIPFGMPPMMMPQQNFYAQPPYQQSQPNVQYQQPTYQQSQPNVQYQQPPYQQSQPNVEYSQPTYQQSQPNVQHSEPKIAQSQPNVDYNQQPNNLVEPQPNNDLQKQNLNNINEQYNNVKSSDIAKPVISEHENQNKIIKTHSKVETADENSKIDLNESVVDQNKISSNMENMDISAKQKEDFVEESNEILNSDLDNENNIVEEPEIFYSNEIKNTESADPFDDSSLTFDMSAFDEDKIGAIIQDNSLVINNADDDSLGEVSLYGKKDKIKNEKKAKKKKTKL